MNRFQSEDAFCAESEMTIQALKLAEQLKLDKVCFEGDASNVILALKGLTQFDEWRAAQLLFEGRKLLKSHVLWGIVFVPRDYNSTTLFG